MGPQDPWIHQHEQTSVLHIETCRPHFLSRGWVSPEDLKKAEQLIEGVPPDHFLFLCIHYPLFNRDGSPHTAYSRTISNGDIFRSWLAKQPRIDALLHGHEHHGYLTHYTTEEGTRPSINPGSSGYHEDLEKERWAHFNLYTVDKRSLLSIERYRFKEDGFILEEGGAYASGR